MNKRQLQITQFIGIGYVLLFSIAVYAGVTWLLAAILGFAIDMPLIVLACFVCTFHQLWNHLSKMPEQNEIVPSQGEGPSDDDLGTP